MENFKTNFARRPNLFDDDQISTERIQKYRTAQTINVAPVNPLQKVIEKLKENPFQSSISTIPAPLKMLQTIKCFPMAESFNYTPVMEVIKENNENNFIEYSLTDFQPKDSKGQKVIPMDFSLGGQMTSNMFATLHNQMPVTQMEISLGECPITSELINVWGNRTSANNKENSPSDNTQTEQGSYESSMQSSEQRVRDHISFDNIELTTSCMVQFTGPTNTGPRQQVMVAQNNFEDSQYIMNQTQTSQANETEEAQDSDDYVESSDSAETEEIEEEEPVTSEEYEDSQVQSQSQSSQYQQSQNQSQSQYQYQSQSQSVQVVVRDSWNSAPVVEMEDKSMGTEELEESMPQIKVLVDQEVDTADLVPEKIEEEKPEMEERGTDTQCLVIHQDQVTDTNELVEEEKRRNAETIRTLRLGFLAQLNGLKKELASVTEEQSRTKKTIRQDLDGTIDNLSDLVKANFNEYVMESKSKQRKNLMVYKQEVAKTKEELGSLRSLVVLSTQKIKETMTNYLQEEGKTQIQKLIEDSAKDRLFQFGLNKLNEYMMDNHSISTESSHVATPLQINTPTRLEISDQIIPEKKTRGRKPKKMDKAVLEGMRYLLGHEGFDQDYKDKLESALKPHANGENEQLTSELVLNSLMGRGRRRKGNVGAVSAKVSVKKEDSMIGFGKRMRHDYNSMRDDESIISQNLTAFDVESIASERLEFSTPVKGGERKKVKRQQYNHPDFLDNNSEKMVLFSKDLNSSNLE